MTPEEAIKSYVQFFVAWIVNRCDIEFEAPTEYALTRLIYDSAESFIEENINQ